MKYIKQYMLLVWRFIAKSSADPKAYSLTVKGVLSMAVTFYTAQLIPPIKIICELGYLCSFVSPEVPMFLTDLIGFIELFVYYSLMGIATVIAAIGAVRKFRRTVEGNNLAIK